MHASARRRTGCDHLAQDITQRVFAILARKASAAHALPSLSAWLYQTTKFECANAMKSERRRERKLRALARDGNLTDSPDSDSDAAWKAAVPFLDEALDRLSNEERELILQRFFHGLKFREIALKTGKSEAACKVRLKRLLEALARSLSKQGVTLSAVGLASGMTSELASASPAFLTKATASALSKTLSLPQLLIHNLQTMSHLKSASLAIAAIALITAGPFCWQQSQAHALQSQLATQSLRQESISLPDPETDHAEITVTRRYTKLHDVVFHQGALDLEQLIDRLDETMMIHDQSRVILYAMPFMRMHPDRIRNILDELQTLPHESKAKQWLIGLLSMVPTEEPPSRTVERFLESGSDPDLFPTKALETWVTEEPMATLQWFEGRFESGSLVSNSLYDNPPHRLLRRIVNGVPDESATRVQGFFINASVDLQALAREVLLKAHRDPHIFGLEVELPTRAADE